MKILQKSGALSAFYLAFAYITGIIIFLFILNYPSIVEPSQKIDLLVKHELLIYATNLLMYVFFGFFLIVLLMSIYSHFKEKSKSLIPIATVIGFIWAGLLIGSGMVSNAGIAPALKLYQDDPAQAATFWLGIEAVANGLGGANGEILGGIMTLLISIAGLRTRLLQRGLHILGIFVGIIGVVSTVPGLSDFAGLFGMSQILWFVWIGLALLKDVEKRKGTDN